MATIYKHGGEIGRLDRLTDSILFCADGKVLRDYGSGWKLWRRVKSDLEGGPRGAFERCRDDYQQRLSARPAYVYWRSLVHGFPLRKRSLVVDAAGALSGDLDGFWAELEDRGCPVSLEEARALLDAFQAMRQEAKNEQ